MPSEGENRAPTVREADASLRCKAHLENTFCIQVPCTLGKRMPIRMVVLQLFYGGGSVSCLVGASSRWNLYETGNPSYGCAIDTAELQ